MEAKELRYTEPDPRDDLNGMDVARKGLIIARESGFEIELDDITMYKVFPDSFDPSGTVEEFLNKLPEVDEYFANKIAELKKENKVLRIKINTSLKDVIDKYIDINSKCDYIINGLMTGFKINNIDNFIITKEVESINIMKKKTIKESKCIKCGWCIKVCPYGVNPVTLANKENCTKCGLCTYICPCYINLKERLK